MVIMAPQGVPFHPVVVIGLGKNLLFKSVLGHCALYVVWILLFLQLDIILDQDAFVHFYKGPTEILEPIASHTMFLIDLSISMAGSKLIMAKESLILLLEDLNEKDYFKIIFFSEKWIRDLPQTFTGW